MRSLEAYQKITIVVAVVILYVSVQPWLLAQREKHEYMLLAHPTHFTGMIGGTIVAGLLIVWAFAPKRKD